jgi:hypothetical protein
VIFGIGEDEIESEEAAGRIVAGGCEIDRAAQGFAEKRGGEGHFAETGSVGAAHGVVGFEPDLGRSAGGEAVGYRW